MSRTHQDSSGTFDLDTIHHVTPYKTSVTLQDPNRPPGTTMTKERIVGMIHDKAGHALVTDTDYTALTAKVFGQTSAA